MADKSGADGGLRELALFAGAGGGILGGHLLGWRTVCAVEYEPYAASVLVARQNDGLLPAFPIWDDVRTFDGRPWRGLVDVVSGGFPCQDISVAGRGKGLEGKRSGLFFQIIRLTEELKPRFVFLENVPAIRTRGLDVVLKEFTRIGYDCRWTVVSAAEVGAPHLRKRWFLLAHSNGSRIREQPGRSSGKDWEGEAVSQYDGENNADWWITEPDVGRVVNGLPCRVDRIRCLGNSVVPQQAQEAFKKLIILGGIDAV